MRTRRKTRARRVLGCLILAAAAFAASAQNRPGAQEPYAVVAGTVFRDPGFTQPGAKVVLALESQPGKKLQEQTSSPMGEFAFRVRPEPNRYVVTATLKGFEPASKAVEISGQEQARATLVLVPESNGKGGSRK